MSDIVERLRDDQPGERQCVREARMDLGGLLIEAADEIEKLRAENEKLRTVMQWLQDDLKKSIARYDISIAAYENKLAALGEKE